MSATYVVREGPARVIPALAVAVAGFALPMVVGPMIVGAAVLTSMTDVAQGLISEPRPMKQAARPVTPAAKATPKPAATAAPAAVAKAPEQPATPTPAPAPVAMAPEVKPAAAPEKPEPVAPLAKPEPMPEAPPVVKPKAQVAVAKPKKAAAKPKPEASGLKMVARPSPPAAQGHELKRVTGLRHNDLMTAVLDGDMESVTELLRLGKWPDKPDSRGVTPLMVAAERGDLRMAEALLRAGADARSAGQLAQKRGDGDMMVLLARYRR
jgi:hypothetical protein